MLDQSTLYESPIDPWIVGGIIVTSTLSAAGLKYVVPKSNWILDRMDNNCIVRRTFLPENAEMHAKIIGHLQILMQAVKDDPALQGMLDKDPRAEISPLLHNHIQDPALLIGYDFLALIRGAEKIIEENKYDITKIRRRVEEHLRKYATEQSIILLALFLGVPTK